MNNYSEFLRLPLTEIKSNNPIKLPTQRRKVFVSYHHDNDQFYADHIRNLYGALDALIDQSLDKEIESNNDDYILHKIRTEHLKESTVTIVLVGSDTWKRKWIDWEIYSSLRPYRGRTINGLLGIILPTATYLPPRLEANCNFQNIGFGVTQTGYARLLSWEQVFTPVPKVDDYYHRIQFNQQTQRNKRSLMKYIEECWQSRNRININNNIPRFEDDLE